MIKNLLRIFESLSIKIRWDKNKYYYLLAGIFLLAFILRFYDFPKRWPLGVDQSRDIMVARESLMHGVFPFIGSFSSAGPFVFGPLFYWFIMACYWVAPNLMAAPWIALGLIDVLLVIVMAYVGKVASGNRMALILGFFSAISTSQIMRTSLLTQHTFVALSAALTLLCFLLALKKKQARYIFFMGLSIGMGISMHYQALNLLLFGVVVFLYTRFYVKPVIVGMISFITGLFIPSLPLLYWDFVYQHGANINNILDYFLLGQYRIWVSNRWLTYALDFWPTFWGNAIGGYKTVGLVIMAVVAIVVLYSAIKGTLKKSLLWLGLLFLIQVVLNRYYRGERFEGYMLYFHPLVLFFSAWATIRLIQLKNIVGFGFLAFIILLTLGKDIYELKRLNNDNGRVMDIVNLLKDKYPNQRFSVYEFNSFEPTPSQPISASLYFQNLSGNDGIILGVTQGFPTYEGKKPIYEGNFYKTFQLYELDKNDILKNGWHNVSADYLYEDMVWWWKVKPQKSTFSLPNYLFERLGIINNHR